MPRLSGNNIWAYRGETIPIEVTVYDADGNPVTNIDLAKFAYRQGEVKEHKQCTIDGAVVSVLFSESETLSMDGSYTYEIRVKLGDEVESMVIGRLTIEAGVIISAMT